ncbi:MAG: UDP-3-O-(3-hydroxymyristoyl)glucosamine N-acyltransferase [Burkholderiaceae bacterium]|nr:UDP-3-O-(3-hydroxymyristoyl)glucosamine N-acyltransferase [Burkholderiaceae bacterium]
MSIRLGYITEQLGGELHGDPDLEVESLAPLESAQPGQLSFLANPKLTHLLATCQASCVIVEPPLRDLALARGGTILAEEPALYFARLTQLWRRAHSPADTGGIHSSAVVDPMASVDPTAVIGPLCVVERGAVIGAKTVLKSRVTVGAGCVVGSRCIIHSGAVIGADGFGLVPDRGRWEKVEQLGAVRIGDDVEIGANTCIDRGALRDTVIEDGVKLDNLIQVAHNVRIGAHTVMAACVGVAGSADIGAHCMIGGGANIAGHLQIVDGVQISALSFVMSSISKPGHYTGYFPIDEHGSFEKNAATLRQLYRLRERVRQLEKRA